MSKIAPDLSHFLACGDEVWTDLFGERGTAVRKQALALLTVARSAQRVKLVPGPGGFRATGDCYALPRALSRLSRASRAPRAK